MNKILRTTISIGILLILNNCGFKVVKNNYEKNFKTVTLTAVGDNNINFIIKNKLKKNNPKDNDIFNVDINISTDKKISVKEKNINNKVTKYKIEIKTKVELFVINLGENIKFEIKSHGDYSSSNQINKQKYNEKVLIKRLAENISNEILKRTINRLNDL
ncbi:hypothetical protein OAS35_00215 [Pelagibacteraceae bacterium]|nr:hypothetical protein [Pelagibacteraceae bacterium]